MQLRICRCNADKCQMLLVFHYWLIGNSCVKHQRDERGQVFPWATSVIKFLPSIPGCIIHTRPGGFQSKLPKLLSLPSWRMLVPGGLLAAEEQWLMLCYFAVKSLKLAHFQKSDTALTSLNFSSLWVKSPKRMMLSAWQAGCQSPSW